MQPTRRPLVPPTLLPPVPLRTTPSWTEVPPVARRQVTQLLAQMLRAALQERDHAKPPVEVGHE
jgi:hypothetical protein